MKLRTIDVYGLFESYNHHIELNKEGVTFMHSLNGMGKSTTMRMVADLFNGNMNSLYDTVFRKMVLTFDSDEKIIVRKDSKVEMSLEKNGEESVLDIGDVIAMYNTLYISPERIVVTMEDGRLMPAIEIYSSSFRNFLEKVKSDPKLIPYTGETEEMSDSDFMDMCDDIDDRLIKMAKIGVIPEMPKDLPFPPSIDEYTKDKERYTELLYSIKEWTERHYYITQSIYSYIDIVNSIFTEKTIVINEKDQLVAKIKSGDNDVTLPLNRLSAGEKQILIIFFKLLFHVSPGSLAIIDEPEISLHVSWQLKLGRIFLKISKFRDMQILVATHSPQIIHDRWDLAIELRSELA